MSPSLEEDQGWTTVVPKKTKKNPSSYSGRQRRRHLSSVSVHPEVREAEALIKLIQECIQSFREATNNSGKSEDDFPVPDILSGFEEIVCYGIGNFSQTSLRHPSASLWQLAYILSLKDQKLSMECSSQENEGTGGSTTIATTTPIYFYDPCTIDVELRVLHHFGVEIIDRNEQGFRHARVRTLFYMPHCPASLYHNLLWENWGNFHNCIIIGNSLRYQVNGRLLEKEEDRFPCFRVLFDHIDELPFATPGVEAPLGAFNDTYVIRILLSQKIMANSLERPAVVLHTNMEDPELIVS